VGDIKDIDNQQQSDLPFSVLINMIHAVRITELPYIYEGAYEAGKGSEAEKSVEAKQALHDAIQKKLPHETVDATIIKRDNITAVVIYEPKEHLATVTIDPTQTAGDLWDNVAGYRPSEHSLGGEVHSGLYDGLVAQQNDPTLHGNNMIEIIEGVLHDYASREENKPLNVDFTGFCSGGVKSTVAAGEMIADGFFDDNPNIKLNNIYTFGAIGYANPEFIDKLESNVDRLGGHIWQVQLHGDHMPDVLTPESDSYFTRYHYEQAGEHIYLVPEQNGQNSQVLINPDKATIDALPLAENDDDFSLHHPKPYERVLADLPLEINLTVPNSEAAYSTPLPITP
jgi:hypothetical protein